MHWETTMEVIGMGKIYSILAILLVGMLALSGCAQQAPAEDTAKKAPVLNDENPATEIQEISLSAVVGTFTPNQITVKKGVPVKISITAKEIDPKFADKGHGFAIKELGIDEKIKLGETKVVEFTPTKTGSFVFYCSLFCGEGHMGQTGILHVVE